MIPNKPLRTIYLRGELGRLFGRSHRLAVSSPAEAVRALCVICKGFKDFLNNSDKNGLVYKVLVGKEPQTVEDLTMNHGAQKPYSFVPVLQGSKKTGAIQTIVGAVLVVVGAYFGNPFLVKMGAALIAGGVIQMLTPTPKTPGPQEKPENNPGAYFNGAVNTTQQGQAVAVCYGEVIAGSAVIGAGIHAERVAV